MEVVAVAVVGVERLDVEDEVEAGAEVEAEVWGAEGACRNVEEEEECMGEVKLLLKDIVMKESLWREVKKMHW